MSKNIIPAIVHVSDDGRITLARDGKAARGEWKITSRAPYFAMIEGFDKENRVIIDLMPVGNQGVSAAVINADVDSHHKTFKHFIPHTEEAEVSESLNAVLLKTSFGNAALETRDSVEREASVRRGVEVAKKVAKLIPAKTAAKSAKKSDDVAEVVGGRRQKPSTLKAVAKSIVKPAKPKREIETPCEGSTDNVATFVAALNRLGLPAKTQAQALRSAADAYDVYPYNMVVLVDGFWYMSDGINPETGRVYTKRQRIQIARNVTKFALASDKA